MVWRYGIGSNLNMVIYRNTKASDEIKIQLVNLDIFIAILGLLSAFLFFYLLRFKASKKQTDRINRPKWSKYIPYRDEEKETKSNDADFSDN